MTKKTTTKSSDTTAAKPKSVPAKAKFKTTLLTAGKTATGIKIPPEIVEGLGAGKKPAVKVTINGFTYRSTVAVMNGDFMVGVSAENREGAGVKGGDKIEVLLELDAEPRVVEVPKEFQKALNANTKAKQNFEKLSNSNKKRYVIPINDAKTDETRQRRITASIEALLK
ncbi:MAG TPA: YdeI/OmpD-associated family protein [Chryseolinea sp.]